MKTYKNLVQEDHVSLRSAAKMPTKELGTIYGWLKFGNAVNHIKKGNKELEKYRDVVGSELGKRARGGEEDAKRYLQNRMSNRMDKYGKPVSMKTTPIKKTLSQKIMHMLKGKIK
jgi:3-phosphoglycerate kinase